MKQRVLAYDLMRFIGILCIMIDHANPPGWLYQLRNFGTPLLIVTSALTYASIYRTRSVDVKPFLIKRLKRLIIPAWIFLSFFFIGYYLYSGIANVEFPFKAYNIIGAFTFYKGFRFIWIFKVYIVLALVTPWAFNFKNKFSSNTKFFMVILVGYVLYELVCFIAKNNLSKNVLMPLNDTIFVLIPYTLLFLYGLKLGELSNKTLITLSVVSLCIFVPMALHHYSANGFFVHTSKFKYPPTIYYLSYALAAIHILFFISKYLSKLIHPKLIIWLSSKSLWIYLWHILAYYIWVGIFGKPEPQIVTSIINSLFLLGFGVAATYIQSVLVKRIFAESRSSLFNELGLLLN